MRNLKFVTEQLKLRKVNYNIRALHDGGHKVFIADELQNIDKDEMPIVEITIHQFGEDYEISEDSCTLREDLRQLSEVCEELFDSYFECEYPHEFSIYVKN